MLGGGVLLLTAHACRVRDGVDEPASLFGWRLLTLNMKSNLHLATTGYSASWEGTPARLKPVEQKHVLSWEQMVQNVPPNNAFCCKT